MSVVHVACAARRDYLPHCASMLHSVLARGQVEGVEVHYLHGADVGDADLSLLARMVDEHGGHLNPLHVAPGRLTGLATRSFLPSAHWYRVFLPDLIPDVPRVVYLDADLIVLEPLEDLWNADLGSNYLAAVTNVLQLDHFGLTRAIGVAAENYFNSGVMVMDLEAMRRDGCTDAVLEWAVQAGDLVWPEQDALNVVLGDRRLRLHPRWNCMNSVLNFPWSAYVFGSAEVEEARRRPAIRHFEGPSANKPWHYLSDWDSQRLYLPHREQTPWPHVEWEGRTPATVLRRYVRSIRRRAFSALSRSGRCSRSG